MKMETCTICGREETITCEHKNTEYKTTTTEHWQECIDCGEEIPGTRGAHVGGTHANGGKCTTCEYVYQNHSQSTTIDRYIISPTGHTPVYKCTEPGCTETYTGEEEPHTYEDGVCTECGEKEPTEECTHENKEWHSNETEHWEECVDCGEEIPGTREPHTYQDGTCTECGEKEPTEECTHENKEWHSNEDRTLARMCRLWRRNTRNERTTYVSRWSVYRMWGERTNRRMHT